MASAEVPRDKYGRPMILQADGKLEPYTRASKAAKEWDDTYRLSRHLQRTVIKGVTSSSELLARAQGDDSYTALEGIIEDAIEFAGGNDAARIGTFLHGVTEDMDAGLQPELPAEYANDLKAYERAVMDLEPVLSEGFVVVDHLKIAGSFDRIWDSTRTGVVVGDLKTGKAAPAYAHSAAIQMAIYAHGELYDPATGERSPLPLDLRKDVGLLIHMPIRQGTCDIYELDLTIAWEWAQRFKELKEFRKYKIAKKLFKEKVA